MSTSTTPVLSIQEQLLELKLKEQALAMEQKAIELKRSQNEQSMQLKLEALELKQQAFEQRQKDVEKGFELKQYEAKLQDAEREAKLKLDLQRREDALVNQIEQHTASVKNDKVAIEQDRLSLQQLKMANEQEKTRLFEHKTRHKTTTAVFGEVAALQLSALDLRGRQLKVVSKLVEQRYDDAIRGEYSNQQREQEIETRRQISLDEIATQRKDFEDEKIALREKIRSGQFDLLSNGNDDDFTLGLVKYVVSLPLDRLNVIHTLELDEINAEMILSMNEVDFKSEQFQKRIQACQVLKLDQVEANRIILLSNDEWVNDSLYAKHIAEVEMQLRKHRLMSIIKSCKDNSQHCGKAETIVVRNWGNKLIAATIIIVNSLVYYIPTKMETLINPTSSIHMIPQRAIFNYLLGSDYDSGRIPKLTPDLKLFFSSPNIANGEWIQFHGPGTELYDVDPTFVLYVGSLCDPNKKGKFTSKNIYDGAPGDSVTSKYQISIK